LRMSSDVQSLSTEARTILQPSPPVCPEKKSLAA
jgi:hypothetical protein